MLNIILLMMLGLFLPDGQVLLNPHLIPENGKKLEEFVPKGWKIEQHIEGDLNQDFLPDAVVQLIEAKVKKDDNSPDPDAQRAMLILLKTKDGNYLRAAVANKLLQCVSCGGMLGYGGTGADLRIKNGVLIISQLSGSRDMVELVQLFRFDAATRQFFLIGEDVNKRDRATGSSTSTSTNFLTGRQILESRKYNVKLDREELISKKTKVIQKKRRLIEDVDYEKSLL